MATPVKAVSSLLVQNARRVSPLSPTLLFPGRDKTYPSPARLQNKETYRPIKSYNCTRNSPIPVKIKVSNEYNTEETLLIDSPHKSQLLNFGLNRFDLLYSIGKGSFGTVIKGNYEGKVVAVKIFNVFTNKVNEINAVNLLHKNIIQTFDIIISKNNCLVIMEYYKDSKNLQTVLNDATLNRSTVLKYSQQIANGLKYCHENDVLHLDIKPKNILLCGDTCKICDFGNSARISACHEIYNFRGTIAYTAPEILKGEKPSPKSDIYSLGILMWQLISRKTPYEFLDNEVVIYKVVKFDFRPTFLNGEDEELSVLCTLCWSSDPNERPSCDKVCEALEAME